MIEFKQGSVTPTRPAYSKRPVPAGQRLLRLVDPELARLCGNEAGVPYPARGRRKWLERLARRRYSETGVGWKSWKR